MARVINRLSTYDALLSVDPSSGVAIPLSAQHIYQSSSANFINGSASIFTSALPSGLMPVLVGDRISVTGESGSFESYLSVTGERVVQKVGTISSLRLIVVDADAYLVSRPTVVGASVDFQVKSVYSHSWEVNAPTETVSSNFENLSRYVLKILPKDTFTDIVMTLSNVQLLASDSGRLFQFNAKINSNSKIEVVSKLAKSGELASQVGVSKTLFGGRYGAIRSNQLTPVIGTSDYIYVDIEITISGHSGSDIYFTLPNLVDEEVFYENWFVQNSRTLMPDFYWDYDFDQENPKNPFFKLMDAMMVVANQTREEYFNNIPYEKNEINLLSEQIEPEFRSNLVDPFYVKNEYIPWLSQFTGTKIKRNITLEDGSRLFPNTETENEYARWQLNTGFYGLNAGTREAIIESARQALIFTKDGTQPTKAVALSTGYGGNVFSIRIQTLVNETPDVASDGESSYAILDAVEQARPLGYKIIHTAADVFEFTLGDFTLGVLGSVGLGSE
jgi:hypothetical protein